MTTSGQCEISVNGQQVVSGGTAALRDVWEETSFALERLQAAEECVEAEQQGLKHRRAPVWHLPFTPAFTPEEKLQAADKVRGWAWAAGAGAACWGWGHGGAAVCWACWERIGCGCVGRHGDDDTRPPGGFLPPPQMLPRGSS